MPSAELLVLCYGEGGHHAQARRLHRLLQESPSGLPATVLSVTDKEGIGLVGTEELIFVPLRGKTSGPLAAAWDCTRAVLLNLRQLARFVRRIRTAERVLLVSLGPAFAALPALAVKASRGQVVHIETWSRFTTYSVSGRIMDRVADHFLVQNEELLRLYPGSTYSGRL
jgi:beta-1,4-N-acetylglucosaminyltransferase